MTRWLVPLLIGLLATGGSALSAFILQEPLPDTPDPAAVAVDNAMVYGEWLALLLGGVAGLLYLWRRLHRARGMLAVGLYAVIVRRHWWASPASSSAMCGGSRARTHP